MNGRDKKLDTCGCCEGIKALTPATVQNQPGLTALAYRVGTHAAFKMTMQSAISKAPALCQMTTREDSDPAIALCDAWATVLDVLAFYQERIANEGYLRTATERRSILEMARSIGYELRPGVAASTYMALTVETAKGSPSYIKIPAGLKAQSIPGQDELRQVFETVEEIEARAELNELRPLLSKKEIPVLGDKEIFLKGVSTELKSGDGLLMLGAERMADPYSERWDFRRIKDVITDADAGRTKVTLDEGLGWKRFSRKVLPAEKDFQVFALRKRAFVFGHNAPDWRVMPDSIKGEFMTQGLQAEYFEGTDLKISNRRVTRVDPQVNFDWGEGSPDPAIGSDDFSARWMGSIRPPASGMFTFYTVSDDGVRLWVNGQKIIDNWSLHPAEEDSGTVQLAAGQMYPITLEYFESGGLATIQLSWSGPSQSKDIIPRACLYPPGMHGDWPDFSISAISSPDIDAIHLDTIYPEITRGSWVVLSIPTYQEVYEVAEAVEDSRVGFTLTAKTTRVKLKGEHLKKMFDTRVRDAVVFGQSEELELAEKPLSDPIAGNEIILANQVSALTEKRCLIISGKRLGAHMPFLNKNLPLTAARDEDEVVSEVNTIETVRPNGDQTVITLKKDLINSFDRSTVVIYANVAKATHGETKKEILGSGNGSQAFQKFALKQKPLTYVSAPTPSGAETTLELRVNNLLWEEVATLDQQSSKNRVYITRMADDRTVAVQFGDGTNGLRPPTGAENISATFRIGTGLAGMVKAGQISMLTARPLGIRGVINPLAPSGAADPEGTDDARQNAPMTVLTFERIVSRQDYEEFARAFAGVGKAKATLLWDGKQRLIHITVAGADGGRVLADSELYANLVAGIDAARHPDQRVKVESYAALTFNVKAKVQVDYRYSADDVLGAVRRALEQSFSFARRSFGQAVTVCEVLAIIQAVAGVSAVDLDALYFPSEPPDWNPRLPKKMADWEVGIGKPAKLLTVNPLGIRLKEMTT